MMHRIEVGKPYVEGHTSWPEGIQWNWAHALHELRLFFHHPGPHEIAAVKRGKVEFGLVVARSVIFLVFRFLPAPGMQEGIKWSDAPYTYHRLTEEQKGLPEEELQPGERSLLLIVLVDASTGITYAIRQVSLSHEFTKEMYQAIRAQAEKPYDALQYDLELGGIYAQNNSKTLYTKALVRCVGGS